MLVVLDDTASREGAMAESRVERDIAEAELEYLEGLRRERECEHKDRADCEEASSMPRVKARTPPGEEDT